MELCFVRHGQADHVMNLPHSLHIEDPSLTEVGRRQAVKLSKTFRVEASDLIVISPLRRTIETALQWTGDVNCKRIVHPLVGPRMFPLLAARKAYICDQALPQDVISNEFSQVELADISESVWKRGINSISEEDFRDLAHSFIDWCKSLNLYRIYIVSHDGTITAYRQYLGESVTRGDFLGDAGSHKVLV